MLNRELIQEIADKLDGEPNVSVNEYMCYVAGNTFDNLYESRAKYVEISNEFHRLLHEGGLKDLSGKLGFKEYNQAYEKHAMGIRFMFLEFLSYVV